MEDPLGLVSNITGVVSFFYPHMSGLVCKALPDDNSLSLKVKNFLTAETTKIKDRSKGKAGAEYFNARAQLRDGLILLNGMVPNNGLKLTEIHQMFDDQKTTQRRNVVQDYMSSALDSANKCFGMGQKVNENSLKPEQTVDALQIRIFCTTLKNLEAFWPHINFRTLVDSWITSVQYLYKDPNVTIAIHENMENKRFRNEALFEQIKNVLLELIVLAENIQPVGYKEDMDRLLKEIHESDYLDHHHFLSSDVMRQKLKQVALVAASPGTPKLAFFDEDRYPLRRGILLIGGQPELYYSKGLVSRGILELFNPVKAGLNRRLKTCPSVCPPRKRHTAGILDGKVYITGGMANSEYLKSTEIFDPETGNWTEGPNLISARARVASAVVGKKLFVFGGENENQDDVASCEMLDLSINQWNQFTSMNHRHSKGAAIHLDGCIYVIGGLVDGKVSSLVQHLDVKTGEWSSDLLWGWLHAVKSMNTARCDFAAASMGRTVVVCGGYGKEGEELSRCERYDTRMKSWMNIANLNQVRVWHQLVNYNEQLVALGGESFRGNNQMVEIYDEKMNVWIANEVQLGKWRYDFAAVVL